MKSMLNVDDSRLESIVVAAADAFTDDLNAGRKPTIEAYAEKYPDIANVIRQVFPALVVMEPTDSSGGRIADFEGQPLGDFLIVREIGRGGMGVVYEAEQLSIGRRMALKVLPFASLLEKQKLVRFKNEARAAGTLDHPNIVAVHSVGEDRGIHYYAMQLVRGKNLAEVIEEMKEFFDSPRFGGFDVNARGQLAFDANLTGADIDETNDHGIWAEDLTGSLQLIARKGDLLDVDDGPSEDMRTIANVNWPSQSAFNDLGQLVFQAEFTDGTGGVFVSNLVAVLALEGDYNASGAVEQADLDLVLLNWGDTPQDPTSIGWLNDPPTGAVAQDELDKVLLGWGDTSHVAAATSAVPEPAAALILIVTLFTALAIRPERCRTGWTRLTRY